MIKNEKGCEFRIPDSRFLTFHKPSKSIYSSGSTGLLPLLHWVKTIATWKTVIESMQSLGMDNVRVAYTRNLAFHSDNPSSSPVMSNTATLLRTLKSS